MMQLVKNRKSIRLSWAVGTATVLFLVAGNSQPQSLTPQAPGPIHPKEVDERKAAEAASAKQMSRVFAPSLETMERTDFLLTPALLMQEAISENVVITYPS